MATRKRAPDRCRSTPHPARHEARRHTAIRVHLSPKASRHVFEVTFEAIRSRTHWARLWAHRAGLTAGSTALTHPLGSLLGLPHRAYH